MNKRNKLIIGTVVGVGLIGGGITTVLLNQEAEPVAKETKVVKEIPKTQPKTKEEEKDKGYKPLNYDEELYQYGYREQVAPIGTGKNEYEQSEAIVLKKQLLDLAEDGDVDKLVKRVQSLLPEYRFSEGMNLDIAGIYSDANVLLEAMKLPEKKQGAFMKGSIKTPEMLVLTTLFIGEEPRRSVIKDSRSLTPLFDGYVTIVGDTLIKDKKTADKDTVYRDRGVATNMFSTIDGLKSIHKIEFYSNNEKDIRMFAYVAQDAVGVLTLEGIYIPDETKHYYQDINYFKELDKTTLEPNEERVNKEREKEATDGKLSEEEADAFFNN